MKKSIGIRQSHSAINTNMEEKMCFKTIILTYIRNGKEQVSQASYYHLHTTRIKPFNIGQNPFILYNVFRLAHVFGFQVV